MAFIPTAFIPTAFIPTALPRPLPHKPRQTYLTTPKATLSRRQALLLPLLLPLIPSPAHADRTYAASRRSYDRYHPRILEAISTFQQIRSAVQSQNSSDANSLITDKVFDIKARRAFSIYATSFSDNYLGERSRAMLKCVDGMYNELALVASGTDMDLHYGNALDWLKKYYIEARLPGIEIEGLAI